jgi:hypothetical protein
MVDAGEVDARRERARHNTYNGIRQSIASNTEVLNPQNGNTQAKSGDSKDDISAIIAKYINLKHPPPEEINNSENNFHKKSINDSLEISENSAEGVRRKLAERDRELAEILKDDDLLREGRSTLSTSTLFSFLFLPLFPPPCFPLPFLLFLLGFVFTLLQVLLDPFETSI